MATKFQELDKRAILGRFVILSQLRQGECA